MLYVYVNFFTRLLLVIPASVLFCFLGLCYCYAAGINRLLGWLALLLLDLIGGRVLASGAEIIAWYARGLFEWG